MRELNIDWSGLHSAFQMAMPEVRSYLCLTDGKIVKVPPGDQGLAEIQANSADYVPIETIPSRIQYQWVDEFTKLIEDEPLRTRVEAAINGKGAFRRFKDILLTTPDERRRWFEFRDEKMRQRIVEWVLEKGIEALNEPSWADSSAAETHEAANDPLTLEALRDFLIEWADDKNADALQPIELEKLAGLIGDRFVLKPRT